MNPDQPSREQIEARLTALLLGELPPAEAELLRWSIERDPELKKLHDQLKLTISFVREATKNPAGASVEKEALLKMSAERRQKLLAHFKTDRPKPLIPPLRRKMSPLIPALAAVAIAALLVAMLLPVQYASKSLRMVGSLSGPDDSQQLSSADLDGERKELSARLQPATPTVTRNPQETMTPPPLAQIVLPKTEQSQSESEQDTGVVYAQNGVNVNVSPGESSITPVQQESKTAPVVVVGSPGPGSISPQAETEAQPIAAGGNYTVSATEPNSAPVVEAPSAPQPQSEAGPIAVTAIPPSSAPTQLRETKIEPIATGGNFAISTSPAPAPGGLSDSFEERVMKDRNHSYGGGAGGGGGGGAGGIGFGTGATPSNAYANNTFGGSGGTVSFGGAINGIPSATMRFDSPHLSPSDNVTNAIAENQGAFYGFANNSIVTSDRNVGVEGSDQSALIQRQYENATTVGENDHKKVGVTPIPGSAPESAGIHDSGHATMSPIPTLTEAQMESYNELLIERQAEYVKEDNELAQLKALQATNPQALRDVLPTITFDNTLSDLLGKFRANEQNAKLNQEIDDRVNGLMFAFETKVMSEKAALDGLNAAVKVAESNDQAEAVRGQPYWEAKRRLAPPPSNAPIPQPEVQTRDNAFSTFSLNVSDVSFKLAQASLANGQMPNPDSIRGEEFINAFDYHDPEPLQGQPLAFMSERARDPFAQERDLLRFSIKAAAAGRQEGRALNLVLLLDTSGSMERADRVAIIREALRVLSAQLQPQDTVSVVTFARTARLWADGVPGGLAGVTLEKVGSITPEGGTNLEEAMRLAYETARRHFIANGMNRVVLLTDGAANLGNVDPQTLTRKVESERRKGIALDCFGIGWEDYNDDMLEQLSSNGDGRYAFINSPDEAGTEFAAKLAGALQVAAEDVKVQVEFNPDRVAAWRQIGYAKHQLTKEQFRDNTVAAGTIAAREAGNALYVIETKPDGEGPIATVRVRYRVPGTQDNRERSWLVDYTGTAPALAQASPAMRLAATAAEFSEWLSDSPYAQNVTPDELLNYLSGIPQSYGADGRPKQLEWMIRQAKSVSGK